MRPSVTYLRVEIPIHVEYGGMDGLHVVVVWAPYTEPFAVYERLDEYVLHLPCPPFTIKNDILKYITGYHHVYNFMKEKKNFATILLKAVDNLL